MNASAHTTDTCRGMPRKAVAWWVIRWVLLLVLAFDQLSAPFHEHHHDGLPVQHEMTASHAGPANAAHAELASHDGASHSSLMLRSEVRQQRVADAVLLAETIAVVSLLQSFLTQPPELPASRWYPASDAPLFRSHRSLPPAGRAPPLSA